MSLCSACSKKFSSKDARIKVESDYLCFDCAIRSRVAFCFTCEKRFHEIDCFKSIITIFCGVLFNCFSCWDKARRVRIAGPKEFPDTKFINYDIDRYQGHLEVSTMLSLASGSESEFAAFIISQRKDLFNSKTIRANKRAYGWDLKILRKERKKTFALLLCCRRFKGETLRFLPKFIVFKILSS